VSESGKLAGHVFISYVREDSARVDELQRALEAAGIPVWRDTADLWPGEDWRANIRRAITNNALVFIACFSQAGLDREESYQNEELILAIEQLRRRRPDNPWLIPVRFDKCQIPDLDLGAGRTLASIQWADLFGYNAESNVIRLISAIQRILRKDSKSAEPGEPNDPGRDQSPDMVSVRNTNDNQAKGDDRELKGSFTGKTLIWLSGASPDILRMVPTMRPKYIGNGSSILVTGLMAAISTGFALYMVMPGSVISNISLALLAGLAITILDRWLIISMRRHGNRRQYFILTLPRFTLGLLLAVAISTPLILRIFQPEINQQISVMHVQALNEYSAQLKNSSVGKKMTQDADTVTRLQGIIDSNGTSYQDPTINSLIAQKNNASNQADDEYFFWQCELGKATGACPPPDGSSATTAHQNYINAQAKVNRLNSKINELRSAAVTSAKSSLPTARRVYQQDVSERDSMTANFEKVNQADTGLLTRLDALNNLTPRNGTLTAAIGILFIFFMLIECLPVLVKMLTNLGPPDSYEELLAFTEDMHLRSAMKEY